MAVKFASLIPIKKIPIPGRANLSAYLSSLSCASVIQINPESESYPDSLNSFDFDAKIQFLMNKLHPDSLNRVLDTTEDLNSSMKLFKWASLQKRFQHTADTYYRIILKLGMAGDIEEMESFCNEMVKAKCPGARDGLVALMDAFVENCRLTEALRVLVIMISGGLEPTIGDFNGILRGLVKEKKDFRNVVFVYKEMVKAGIAPNVETLNSIMQALFQAERIDNALVQYRRMNKKGCSPNARTFHVLINGLTSIDRGQESLVVLGEMFKAGCEPDLSIYASIMPVFCRMNKLEVAIRLFKRMRASEIVPDAVLYSVLIQCLCENLLIDEAVNFLEDMIYTGLQPPNDTYLGIIEGFCKLNRFMGAKKLLEDQHVLESSPYNALLGAYCNSGEFLAAIDLFNEMIDKNVADGLSCNILIRGLCEYAGINKAFEFLCRMIVCSCVPDSATFSALIIGKCKSNEIEDALKLFHQVQIRCCVIDSVSYAELVKGLCQKEMIQKGAEIFCYMSNRRCSLQSSSFDMLIKGLCNIGRVESAIKMLQLAFYSSTSCSKSTYNAMMLSLSISHPKGVLVMLSRMVVKGWYLDKEAYCVLIRSMDALSRPEDCALLFNMMISEGLLPDSETLAYLLSILAKSSQLRLILSSINKLVRSCEILNSEMYNILINGLWKENNRSEACHLLDLMLEKGWVPDAETHKLLVGSQTGIESSADGSSDMHDKISSILAESLGKT